MSEIKKFSVDALNKYKNENIHFVLLRLVQEFRYERLDSQNQYLLTLLRNVHKTFASLVILLVF